MERMGNKVNLDVFPFAAIVGQDMMKRDCCSILSISSLGGVLILGEKGTAKIDGGTRARGFNAGAERREFARTCYGGSRRRHIGYRACDPGRREEVRAGTVSEGAWTYFVRG